MNYEIRSKMLFYPKITTIYQFVTLYGMAGKRPVFIEIQSYFLSPPALLWGNYPSLLLALL